MWVTYDVEEYFILPVFDAFGPPADGVGDGHRRARSDVQLVTLLRNKLLQDFTV